MNVSVTGDLTLAGVTLQGGYTSKGGGIRNDGSLSITNSTISGNASTFVGGGVLNGGTMSIANSTISGNSAGGTGGGGSNDGTLTITNSTITGNSAARGGGVDTGYGATTLSLIGTLVSGNTADAGGCPLGCGPEIYNYGAISADNFNLFGHDGNAGVVGFTPGATDVVPTEPLSAILNPTLANNGGPTQTHAWWPVARPSMLSGVGPARPRPATSAAWPGPRMAMATACPAATSAPSRRRPWWSTSRQWPMPAPHPRR